MWGLNGVASMKSLILTAVLGAALIVPAAIAEEHVVEMRNIGSDA